MTYCTYINDLDKLLITNSYKCLLNIVFGSDLESINKFKKIFNKYVKNVYVYDQLYNDEFINRKTPGECIKDKDGLIVIKMHGYENAKDIDYDFIRHEGIHEFSHAFANILYLMNNKRYKFIKNNILIYNEMGLIKEEDVNTHEYVGQKHYGKLFNETMMEIISSLCIHVYFLNDISFNEIINNNYKSWKTANTKYLKLTDVTRAVIFAFSNDPNIDYNEIINNKKSIFLNQIILNDNNKYYSNDFLYGIMFDHLHIDLIFDKYMGLGSYRIFCEYVDRFYLNYMNDNIFDKKMYRKIIYVLNEFLNRKCDYYLENNIMEIDYINKLKDNFINVLSSLDNYD